MSDSSTLNDHLSSPDPSASPSVEEMRREKWRNRGFDPDVEIRENLGCFTLSEALRSLAESTRSCPIPVFVGNDDRRTPVVIDLATTRYLEGDVDEDDDLPNWYFEGWRVPSGYSVTGTVEIQRIRIMVLTLTREFADDDMFEWQYIPTDVSTPVA